MLICGQKGLLKYKSIEHSPVGFAVLAELLDEKQALEHPDRHLVSNVVGEAEMHIDLGPSLQLAENDTVLLASDGIFDNFTTDRLIEVIRKDSLEEVTQKLFELVQPMQEDAHKESFNKLDDVSFIVCRIAK